MDNQIETTVDVHFLGSEVLVRKLVKEEKRRQYIRRKNNNPQIQPPVFFFLYQGANDHGSEKDKLLVAQVAGRKLEHILTDSHWTQHVRKCQGRKEESEKKKHDRQVETSITNLPAENSTTFLTNTDDKPIP